MLTTRPATDDIPAEGGRGPVDALALAVEVAAGLQPFGIDRIDGFEARWTQGLRSRAVHVPFHRRDDVTMSVMLRLG